MKTSKLFKRICTAIVMCVIIILNSGCSESDPDAGKKKIYSTAQQCVVKYLDSPSSAVFPEFDHSFVSYQTSILEDLGEGTSLEYRIYDVNAYVESQNEYGVMMRQDFHVEVALYVDDFPTPKFGEEGIHKGIENHCYSALVELN